MLDIICGKPGSGKTYHCASMLVDMLTDWCKYEKKNNQKFSRRLFTNIQINVDQLNKVIESRLGFIVEVGDYIEVLPDDFFESSLEFDSEGKPIFWWCKLPSESLIVIDEVHKYLGKSFERSEVNDVESFVNWLSTHRHQLQDLIFLTQHIENFAVQILGIADGILEVVNLKSQFLPFPLNIPVSDLDVIKESFGVKTQYYVVNHGKLRGRYVRWTGGTEKHLMVSEIFEIYQSHSLSEVSGDRPSLSMSRVESIFWFLRKHGYHLVPKFIGFFVGIPLLFYIVLFCFPSFLVSSVSSSKVEVVPSEHHVKNSNLDIVKNEKLEGKDYSFYHQIFSEQFLYIEYLEEELFLLKSQLNKIGEVVSLFEGGFLLRGGRRILVGEVYSVNGVDRVLQRVDVLGGILYFDSGEPLFLFYE